MNSDDIFKKMSRIMEEYLRLDPDEISRDSHVINDLGADSLALVELGFKFMEAFEIGMIDQTDNLLVIGNLVDHIAALKKS